MNDNAEQQHPDIVATARQLEAAIRMLVPQDLTPAGANILRRIARTLTGGSAPDYTARLEPGPLVTHLTSADTGTWLIHTSNGAHLLDLDRRILVDINRPQAAPRTFERLLLCAVGKHLIISQAEDDKFTVQFTNVTAIEPWPRVAPLRKRKANL